MTSNDQSEVRGGTRASYQHSRRQQPSTPSRAPLATVSGTTVDDVAIINEINGAVEFLTVSSFSDLVESRTGSLIGAKEAENRLRGLTARGWLHMSAHRDESGAFVEYRWEVR